MNASSAITGRARFFWFLGGALAIYGFVSWFTVAKEEDPRLKPRFGTINIIYPGASPVEMNKYVVREVEKEFSAVTGIEHLDVLIRSEFAFFRVELKGAISADAAITREWDDVEAALRRAESRFPQGVVKPQLNRKALDQEAILIALTGPDAARHRALVDLETELLKIRNVSAVTNIGDEGRQVTLTFDRNALAASGLTSPQVIGQVLAANQRLGTGSIDVGGDKINLKTVNGFEAMDDIRNFTLTARNGGSIILKSISQVDETVRRPATQEMRWKGKPASALGIVARQEIDLVRFGDDIAVLIGKFEAKGGVDIEIINSQPAFVRSRLNELAVSLLESMIILGAMMLITMGIRVGLVVTLMLPLISLIALALNSIVGGVLQQISIAAFVMSLGLLIDNIIVVAESVQEQIDRGVPRMVAATKTVSMFAVPLLSSTLTTVASFLPMLLAKGTTSEFTFAIPAIAITTLSVSWLAAVYLTPTLAAWGLKRGMTREWPFLDRVSTWISSIATGASHHIVFGIGTLIIVAVLSAFTIGQKFFPSADRQQLVIEILYPEGTALSRTRKAVDAIEARLGDSKFVNGYASFIGRSTPRFYYNLNQQPNAPHLAQILVMTTAVSSHTNLRREIGELALTGQPRIIVRSLEQGPPIPAPVEIRLLGPDILPYADMMVSSLSAISGAGTVRHDAEGFSRELRLNPRDRVLAENGLTRNDLALAALQATRGIPAGFFRTDTETLPIIVAYNEAEKTTPTILKRAVVGQNPDHAITIADTAVFSEKHGTGILHRRDRENVVRVLAETNGTLSAAHLLSHAKEYIKTHPLPSGARYEIGGEVGESLKANGAILAAMPLAMIILIAILIWEFNSLKLTLIILTCVPTAALGVLPGLAIGRKPFGFMALLALFALIGIVVNNGILLIDRFKSAQAEGKSREAAVRIGIRERLRPILLTSGSTILGMVPLTFTDSTLWPPFAWAMMSGLGVSTLFTLFIVPWLYAKLKDKKIRMEVIATVALFAVAMNPLRAVDVPPITTAEVLVRAADAPSAKAAWHRAAIASAGKNTEILGVWGPKITAGGEYILRDRDFFLQTPFGQFPYGRQNYGQLGVEVYQTLWASDSVLSKIPAAARRERAAALMAEWESMSAIYMALSRFYDCAELGERQKIARERVKNLESLTVELRRLARSGRSREIDQAKVAMKTAEARNGLDTIGDARRLCEEDLGRLTASDGPRTPLTGEKALPPEVHENDIANRPDLKSLETFMAALEAERDGILLESLPEIYARGNYTHYGARQFTPEDWFQASIGARWRILDGGTQITRRQMKAEAYEEKRQQLVDARRAAKIQLNDVKLRLKTSKEHAETLVTELIEYSRILSREKSRVAQGRVSATEFLEAMDGYWKRRERAELIALEIVRLGWTQLYLMGTLKETELYKIGLQKF